MDSVLIVGTVSNICVLHTASSRLRFFRLVMPADGMGALTTFGQAMTLRLVPWLYPGDVLCSTEDVLFRELDDKPLSPEHRQMMETLAREHVEMRHLAEDMVEARERYLEGDQDALKMVEDAVGHLSEL